MTSPAHIIWHGGVTPLHPYMCKHCPRMPLLLLWPRAAASPKHSPQPQTAAASVAAPSGANIVSFISCRIHIHMWNMNTPTDVRIIRYGTRMCTLSLPHSAAAAFPAAPSPHTPRSLQVGRAPQKGSDGGGASAPPHFPHTPSHISHHRCHQLSCGDGRTRHNTSDAHIVH